MAVEIAASVVVQSGGTSANTASFSVPTGTAENDLGLIVLAIGTGQGSVFNTPSGWTEVWQDNLNAAGTTGRWVAYRRLEPASPASVNVTWTSYARWFVGARLRITGHHPTAPVNVLGSLASGGVAPNASPPQFTVNGVTTTADNCLLLAALAWQWGAFSGTPYATPTGWSAAALNHTAYANGERPSSCLFQRTAATAGPTGGVTITAQNVHNPDSTSRSWGGRMLAIAPDDTPPPPPPLAVRGTGLVFW